MPEPTHPMMQAQVVVRIVDTADVDGDVNAMVVAVGATVVAAAVDGGVNAIVVAVAATVVAAAVAIVAARRTGPQ